MTGGSRPLRALALALAGWAGARAYFLWPGPPPVPAHAASPPLVALPGAPRLAPTLRPSMRPVFVASRVMVAIAGDVPHAPRVRPTSALVRRDAAPPQRAAIAVRRLRAPVTIGSPPVLVAAAPDGLTVSVWLLTRGGAAGPGAAGTLGGSQGGARIFYTVSGGLGLTGRISAPLHGKGGEASAGVGYRGRHFGMLAERRFALGQGGRDAFSVTAFAGIGDVALPARFRLDGYIQAGLVGLKRRDGFADGAVRLERPVLAAQHFRIGAGAGLWAGAQPGLSRVDAGPQIVAHFGHFRVGGEYRFRVAGDAAPGSGPALSLGADF